MGKLSVLVVDDEPDLRELIRDEFEMDGWTVYEARNGDHAFEVLSAHRVDAIVSDVRMPGGNGLELLARVQASLQTLPNAGAMPFFVLLTGFADLGEEDLANLGAHALVQKPFKLRPMVEAVRAGVTGASKAKPDDA